MVESVPSKQVVAGSSPVSRARYKIGRKTSSNNGSIF